MAKCEYGMAQKHARTRVLHDCSNGASFVRFVTVNRAQSARRFSVAKSTILQTLKAVVQKSLAFGAEVVFFDVVIVTMAKNAHHSSNRVLFAL